MINNFLGCNWNMRILWFLLGSSILLKSSLRSFLWQRWFFVELILFLDWYVLSWVCPTTPSQSNNISRWLSVCLKSKLFIYVFLKYCWSKNSAIWFMEFWATKFWIIISSFCPTIPTQASWKQNQWLHHWRCYFDQNQASLALSPI